MIKEKNRGLLMLNGSYALMCIIFLAIAIRMVFFIFLQPWENAVVTKDIIVFDAAEYHLLALSFLSDKSFEHFNGFRTPGYPVFVAILYSISSGKIWFVLLVQIILNSISVVLVYQIAKMMFEERIALISAFLFAIDIHQAEYSITLCSDTLFVFLFLMSVYYLSRSSIEKKVLYVLLSAFVLGVATLVRPVTIFFPIIVVIFIFLFIKMKNLKKFSYSLIFSLVFMISISPWIFRNYSKFGEAKFTSQSGTNLLLCNVVSTEAYRTGKSIQQVDSAFLTLATIKGADTSKGYTFKNSKIYSEIAQDYLQKHYLLYLNRHLMGIVNLYANIGTQQLAAIFHLESTPLPSDSFKYFSGPGLFKQILHFLKWKSNGEIFIAFSVGVFLIINYLFAIYALFILLKKNERLIYLFILIIIYFSVITGVIGLARLRIPFMPFINILCAFGIMSFYTKLPINWRLSSIFSNNEALPEKKS